MESLPPEEEYPKRSTLLNGNFFFDSIAKGRT